MGLFNRKLRKREETVDPADMVNDVLLRAMLRDEPVTREMAMTVPAVSQCVDFISGAIAAMPVKLYRIVKGKIYEQSSDTRVRILNGDTGDTLDAYQLKKAMVSDYLMAPLGGGYAYIDRTGNDVVGLHYVDNIWIAFEKNYRPIYKDYNILVEGQKYYPWDFLKLVRNTVDGSEGQSLTQEVGKALEAAYQTLVYQVAMLRTGGNKKGFIKSEKVLTEPAMDKLKEAWKKLYQNNTENVVVLNNGLDFKEASQTSVELQLNESKETFADEIRGIFHIYLNDENRTFKEAIYPIVKAFETAMNRDLLTEEEKRNGKYFFELDVKEIVRANLSERYSAYKMAKETGFMTLNEIRRAENMTEVDGLDVVNVGLGAVLYDTEKHVYYTPNTDTIGNVGDADQNVQQLIIDKELDTAFEESGNSAEREMRFNPNHDAKGRFASGHGFVRFGAIPANGKSVNFKKLNGPQASDLTDAMRQGEDPESYIDAASKYLRGWQNVNKDEIFEQGVSVFEADENGMPKLNNLDQARSAAVRVGNPYYSVTGKIIATGQDGEPLLSDAKGDLKDIPAEALEDHIINTMRSNYKEVSGNLDRSRGGEMRTFADWKTGEKEVTYKGLSFKGPKSKDWEA